MVISEGTDFNASIASAGETCSFIEQKASDTNTVPFLGSNTRNAIIDLRDGMRRWHLWYWMAASEIKRRYRRTVLGPFWATISLSIFIVSMTFLFSNLWKTDTSKFLPFFAAGIIYWTFISAVMTEGCSTFTAVEGLVKQVSFPYSMFAWVVVMRNLIVLSHHAIVYLLIMIFLKVPFTSNLFFLIPGILLSCLTGFATAIILGLFCARYRDLQQLVQSILQISLFVTPIFWPPEQLSGRAVVILDINPLYHYVSALRLPLLGQAPSLLNWQVVIGTTVLSWLLMFLLFRKKREDIIFWL